jgi:putative membrane protein
MNAAFAHDGILHLSSPTLWTAWTLDPLVLIPLTAAAWLYARGSLRFGPREACFAAGMVGLFLALVWPLDVLGELLFSAHMAQHVVLMNVAAPLLVLGAPVAAMLRAMPPGARRALAQLGAGRRWRAAWHTLVGLSAATLLQQLALWIWHTPRGVAAALSNDAVHVAMHVTLLAAALLFWTAVLRPRSGHYWGAIAALVVTLKVSGAITIVLLLQSGSLFAAYGASAAAFGLTPAEDEQIGWGLMMALGSLSYLASAVALVGLSFARLERAAR